MKKDSFNRKKILFVEGFQLRFAFLVFGSLVVLLLFSGFHAVFVANRSLSPEAIEGFKPILLASTWRLFFVGMLYIAVVTVAAVFLSHRTVGPTKRLEDQLTEIAEAKGPVQPLQIREGDELESLVGAINKIIRKMKGRK